MCNQFETQMGKEGDGNDFILSCQHVQLLIHMKPKATMLGTNSKNSDGDNDDNSHKSGDDKDSDWESAVEKEHQKE